VTSRDLDSTIGGYVLEEMRKVPAFFRRDMLTMFSYKFGLIGDWLNMATQIVIFYLVGGMVTNTNLPNFGRGTVSYIEFAAVGIAIMSFLQIGLTRVLTVIRNEQLMGTLEYLLTTPTSPTVLQLGSVMYDLIYIPIRTVIFLGLASFLFGVDLNARGIGPTLLVVMVFIPFVWGIGMVSAAAVLTVRRGAGVIAFGITLMALGSNTYVPIERMPGFLRPLAEANPISLALDAAREALLGTAGWAETASSIAALVPISLGAVLIGVLAFRFAMRWERKRGTLGLY
jgi:ABC-2 type transport system permease protein